MGLARDPERPRSRAGRVDAVELKRVHVVVGFGTRVDDGLVGSVDAILGLEVAVRVHRLRHVGHEVRHDAERPAGGALPPGVEPSLGAPEPHADGLGSAAPRLAPLVPDVPPRSAHVVDAVPGVGVVGRAERGPATDPVRALAERVECAIEDPVVRAVGVRAVQAVRPGGGRKCPGGRGDDHDARDYEAGEDPAQHAGNDTGVRRHRDDSLGWLLLAGWLASDELQPHLAQLARMRCTQRCGPDHRMARSAGPRALDLHAYRCDSWPVAQG